jgi:hypothetical protein
LAFIAGLLAFGFAHLPALAQALGLGQPGQGFIFFHLLQNRCCITRSYLLQRVISKGDTDMAYWTVAGDPKNDAAKARECRRDLAKTDWDAEMLRLEKEAEKVRDIYIGKQADRMVARLKLEWLAAARNKAYVETGINP